MKQKECLSFVTGFCLLIWFTGIARAQSVSVAPESDHVTAIAKHSSTYARLVDQGKGMTADDLVRYAFEHNGELAAARATIAEARGRWRQAGLKPNPVLETSGTQAVTSSDNNLMVGVELPLELSGRRRARVTVAEREIEMKEAEVRDFERRLASRCE